MAEVEFERKIRLTRQQAGERLIALGKSLQGGAKSKFEHDGDSILFTVANELDWEFELEIDGDEVELEIELKWSNDKRAASSKPVATSEAVGSHQAATKRKATTKRPATRKRAKSVRKAKR